MKNQHKATTESDVTLMIGINVGNGEAGMAHLQTHRPTSDGVSNAVGSSRSASLFEAHPGFAPGHRAGVFLDFRVHRLPFLRPLRGLRHPGVAGRRALYQFRQWFLILLASSWLPALGASCPDALVVNMTSNEM